MGETLRPRLIVSDVDGVVAHHERVVPEVAQGFHHAQERGIPTTLATGRNYKRLMGMLGPAQEQLIAQEAFGKPNLLIVDGGGTVMKANGEGYHAFPVEKPLREGIADALRHADVNFVAFDPNPLRPGLPEVWVAPQFQNPELLQKFQETYTFIPGSYDNFATRLVETTPSNLAVSLRSGTAYDIDLPDGLSYSANRGVFDLNVAGKDHALRVVQEYFNQPDLQFCIYIGDGWRALRDEQGQTIIENDRPVFLLPDVGLKIIVSEEPVHGISEPYLVVPNAQALGTLLTQL